MSTHRLSELTIDHIDKYIRVKSGRTTIEGVLRDIHTNYGREIIREPAGRILYEAVDPDLDLEFHDATFHGNADRDTFQVIEKGKA